MEDYRLPQNLRDKFMLDSYNKNHIKVCPVCKETFDNYATERWAYAVKTLRGNKEYFCSYTCMNKFLKHLEANNRVYRKKVEY